MGDDLKSLLLFKVSICFGPDEVSAICLSIYMLSLSFTPKLKESVHLFLGSSYVNGPVNCSIGHRVGGHCGHRRAREEKNTHFVMTIFTANRTKRQVLQNGRTIHQTQF